MAEICDNEQIKGMEETLSAKREVWTGDIHNMNQQMRNIAQLPDLLNTVYAKRQDAVDAYYGYLDALSKVNKRYQVEYAKLYNAYKLNAQIRYTSDTAINAQISAELGDMVYLINIMDHHAKYMQETIKSIDNLIYGINNRIRLEELIQGVKK